MRGQACRGNMGSQGGWRNRRKIRCRKMGIWDRYSAANGLDGLEIYDWRAEAVRFELTEGFAFAAFQDQCLNPLGHASKTSILKRAGEPTRIFPDARKITVSDSPGSAMNTALNSSTVETGPALLTFTDSAADKIKQLIDEEDNPKLKLRVFVQGGGCAGFQYGFTFEDEEDKAHSEQENEEDEDEEPVGDYVFTAKNGVQLLIDSMSYQYLVGAEIDYKDDLNGAQFVIKNPNAMTSCGCGSSFSI